MLSRVAILRVIAVLGVVFALVLAGSTPAFAVWGETTYTVWSAVKGTMPGETSPHGGYSTTTQKCKVCHSVHGADPAGVQLLRGNGGTGASTDPCVICHVSVQVSDFVVYGGVEDNYNGGWDYQNAHNADYGETGSRCSDCHSVHAAYNDMTANEALTDKILKGDRVYDSWEKNYDEYAQEPKPLATDNKETAMSKWCTSCHRAATYGYYAVGDYTEPSAWTHVMKDPGIYNRPGMSITPTQVAWSTSRHCSSCHTSQYADGSHSWPHYTSGARFLTSTGASAGTTEPTGVNKTNFDGVCLRCHRNGSLGVGVTW